MNSLSNNSKATFKYFGDELDNLEAIWLTLLSRDRSGSNSALSGQMKFQVREGTLSKRNWTRRHVNRKIYVLILCGPHRLRHGQVFSKNCQGAGGQWSTQPCVQSGTPLCLWLSSSSSWTPSSTRCAPSPIKVRKMRKILRRLENWASYWNPSLHYTSGRMVTLAVTGWTHDFPLGYIFIPSGIQGLYVPIVWSGLICGSVLAEQGPDSCCVLRNVYIVFKRLGRGDLSS